MIRKSVETRDWLNTIEPRNVRSVMKRVVEEVTLIDRQVATLYEEGAKKDQGSGQCHMSGDPLGSGRTLAKEGGAMTEGVRVWQSVSRGWAES